MSTLTSFFTQRKGRGGTENASAKDKKAQPTPSHSKKKQPQPSETVTDAPPPKQRSTSSKSSSSSPSHSSRPSSDALVARIEFRAPSSRLSAKARSRSLRARDTRSQPAKYQDPLPAALLVQKSATVVVGSSSKKKKGSQKQSGKRPPRSSSSSSRDKSQPGKKPRLSESVPAAPAEVAGSPESIDALPRTPSPPPAPKLSWVDKIRMAFDLEELEEKMKLNVEHWTAANSQELEPEVAQAELEAKEKAQQAAEAQAEADRQREAEEEAERQKEEEAAQAAEALTVTKRGRIVKKAAPAGEPLGALGAVPTDSNSQRRASRSSSASRTLDEHTLSASPSSTSPSSSSSPFSSLDPLEPDRLNNEIFQLPASWRLKWQDPAHRLWSKLVHLPLPAFDRPISFELPFEEYGEMMQKFQKKDVVPKFTHVLKNKLLLSRDEFNASMGIVPRKSGKVGRDDEDDARCTCQYRDAAQEPKKGSKEALAEAVTGKSFNCGENCLNRLLKIECTPDNCNLQATGKEEMCGNRLFATNAYFPGVVPFKTEFKGCPTSDIPEGSFILEYVGEIINNSMCQERMAAENERIRKMNEQEMKKREEIRQRERKKRLEVNNNDDKNNNDRRQPPQRAPARAAAKGQQRTSASSSSSSRKSSSSSRARVAYHECTAGSTSDSESDAEYMEGDGPRSSNFYFLTIADDVIIDAGSRGGWARFTNHSCNPNCRVEKWTVDGMIRVGIFANEDIKMGKELTIDYQYDRVGSVHRQACFCGEPNCAKFIGGKKKELEQHSSHDSKKGKKKLKEPTKLDLESADEVCCICGDGGDMLMCDARVCGQFCTRCYHPHCIGLKAEEVPPRWVCPYHFCDECGSGKVKYYCASCSESACEKCWLKSREDDAAAVALANAPPGEPPSSLHQSKVRRDLLNHGRNVWTCCSTCQEDPMCMRTEQRVEFYAELESKYKEAIVARKADQPDFAVEFMDTQALYEAMWDPAATFHPRFIYNFWNHSQQKEGKWEDGYVEPAKRGLADEDEEEESDQAWLQRQWEEKNQQQQQEEEDHEEEEEQKKEEQQPQEAVVAQAAASPSATAKPAESSPTPPSVSPMDIDDTPDADEQKQSGTPPPAVLTPSKAKGKGKANAKGRGQAKKNEKSAPPPALEENKRGRGRKRAPSPAPVPSASKTSRKAPSTKSVKQSPSVAKKSSASQQRVESPAQPSSRVGRRQYSPSLMLSAQPATDARGRKRKQQEEAQMTETETEPSEGSETESAAPIATKRVRRASSSHPGLPTLQLPLSQQEKLVTVLSPHQSDVLPPGSSAEREFLTRMYKQLDIRIKGGLNTLTAVWRAMTL